MRVVEWEAVNSGALISVERGEQVVRLRYEGDDAVAKALNTLVTAEQQCCGAAGVEFHLDKQGPQLIVGVHVIKAGLPSHTVLEAFAAMSPGE